MNDLQDPEALVRLVVANNGQGAPGLYSWASVWAWP